MQIQDGALDIGGDRSGGALLHELFTQAPPPNIKMGSGVLGVVGTLEIDRCERSAGGQ
jgi:hypothetical protein